VVQEGNSGRVRRRPHLASGRLACSLVALATGATAIVGLLPLSSARAAGGAKLSGQLPDLRTVVPRHLNLVNAHQRQILRFSNGIANLGSGPWQMRPVFPPDNTTLATQDAVQEILDADGNVVDSKVVSQFEFHEAHNHWHIGGVALFEVRVGSLNGPLFRDNSIKTTFCLIDWYQLEGNSPTPERSYFSCNGPTQGISPGWVDQYHQATEGQAMNLTGAPAGVLLYLVSTANHEGIFVESDLTNNTAWVSFYVRRDSNGNPRIEIVGNSPCESPGLCGDQAPNR